MQRELEGALPSPELHGEVDALLHQGRFVEAIRLYRSRNGVDLKGSKDAIEARARELGLEPNLSFFAFLRGLWRR